MQFLFFFFCFVAKGGCFVEGVQLRNAFRWKDSVGPWEQRPGHLNDIWNYWTDDGLGFFEGLQVGPSICTYYFVVNFNIETLFFLCS